MPPRGTRRLARCPRWSSASIAMSAGRVAEMLKGLDLSCRAKTKPSSMRRSTSSTGRTASGRSSSRCCAAASACITRDCCRSIAGWSRTCSRRSCSSVAVCTETLAAGINLPARSVVLTSLVKGPFGKEKLIDPSTAHQIFGRAGRPQFDTQGFVFALAHEDDVRILRWKEKYDQIPENTKDPGCSRRRRS